MKAFEVLRDAQLTQAEPSYNLRLKRLKALRDAVIRDRHRIVEAIRADFDRPAFEVLAADVVPVISELNLVIRNLRTWMQPERVPHSPTLLGTRSEIHYRPKGVVLVLGTWNYAFYLCMAPVIDAWAAGNRVIVKPSEWLPTIAHFMADLIAEVFDPSEVTVVEGDVSVAEDLVAQDFDHIFYTGGERVGRIIGKSAAERGIPFTLELGGKGPAVLDDRYAARTAARRIVFGKHINGGQTCIAPDHVFCPEERLDEVVNALGAEFRKRSVMSEMAPMIHAQHYERLRAICADATEKGAEVRYGGTFDAETRRIEPTILSGITPEMRIHREEIFGPLLPIYTYSDDDNLVEQLREHPDPLATYVFSKNKTWRTQLLQKVRAGGVVINDTLLHVANSHLPFGGIGHSGVGNYHGIHGFRTFSHAQARVTRVFPGISRLIYPRYRWWKSVLFRTMIRFFPKSL